MADTPALPTPEPPIGIEQTPVDDGSAVRLSSLFLLSYHADRYIGGGGLCTFSCATAYSKVLQCVTSAVSQTLFVVALLHADASIKLTTAEICHKT